jgi:hypothetical protein
MSLLIVGNKILKFGNVIVTVGSGGSQGSGGGGGNSSSLAITGQSFIYSTTGSGLANIGNVFASGGLGQYIYSIAQPLTATGVTYELTNNAVGQITIYIGGTTPTNGQVDSFVVTVTDGSGATASCTCTCTYQTAAVIVPQGPIVFYNSEPVSGAITFVSLSVQGQGTSGGVVITDPTTDFSGNTYLACQKPSWPAPGNYPVTVSNTSNGITTSRSQLVVVVNDPGPVSITWNQQTLNSSALLNQLVGVALADGSSEVTTYALSNSASGKYYINGLTGRIYVNSTLTQGTDNITVVATRSGITFSFNIAVIVGAGVTLPATNMTMTISNGLNNGIITSPVTVGTPTVTGIPGTKVWSLVQNYRALNAEQLGSTPRYTINPSTGLISALNTLSAQTDPLIVSCTDGVYSCTQTFNVVVAAIVGPTIHIGQGMVAQYGATLSGGVQGFEHLGDFYILMQSANATYAGATVYLHSNSNIDYFANDNGNGMGYMPNGQNSYAFRFGFHGPITFIGVQGTGGPRPRLGGVNGAAYGGTDSGSKGFFVTSAGDFVFNNLEISWVHANQYQGPGSPESGSTGCGIRQNGQTYGNLTVTNCYIHDCDQGIETGDVPGVVSITYTELANNGGTYVGSGATHNAYIGGNSVLIVDNLLSHRTVNGHCLKSRAGSGTITNSRFYDGERGQASCQVELPDGGNYVINNCVFHKGPEPQNPNSVQYCAEMAHSYSVNNLLIQNSTFICDTPTNFIVNGIYMYGRCMVVNGSYTTAQSQNNSFFGYGVGNTEVAVFSTQETSIVTGVSDGRACVVSSTGRITLAAQPGLSYLNPQTSTASPRIGPHYVEYDGENRNNWVNTLDYEIDPTLDDASFPVNTTVGTVLFQPTVTPSIYAASAPGFTNLFASGVTWALVTNAGPYTGGLYGVAPTNMFTVNASTGAVTLGVAMTVGATYNIIINATATSGRVAQQGIYIRCTASTFTVQTSNIPNTLYMIDAAEPASTNALAANTPGIQLDGSNNVLAVNDPISNVAIVKGSGSVSLVQNGPGGFPYFHGTTASQGNAYDSFVMPTVPQPAAVPLFLTLNQPWCVIMVMRQTAAGSTAILTALCDINSGLYTGVNIKAASGATDGQLYIEQNNTAAHATETVSALTALNQWQVVSFISDGNTLNIYRNGTLTAQSASANLGGLSGIYKFELLNNPQADVSFIEIANCCPSITVHNGEVQRLGARYGITVNTVTVGQTSTVAPPTSIDYTQDFLNYPNWPTSDNLPTETTPSLHDGLVLSVGSTSLAAVTFTPGGTTTTRALLDAQFYYNGINGNLDVVVGGGPIDNPTNSECYARIRRYLPGHKYDLHTFGSNGLSLNAIASQNNTTAGISNGTVYGAYLRAPTKILPGMVIAVKYQVPTSRLGWCPVWLYHGGQNTPGPNNNPYTNYIYNTVPNWPNPLQFELTSNNVYYEYDNNDGYARDGAGVAVGQQIDCHLVNNQSATFNIQPYDTYDANGPLFAYNAGSGDPFIACLGSLNLSVGFHNLVMNWRNDGTNLVDILLDGTLIRQQYWEYGKAGTYTNQAGQVVQIPMHLLIGNQAIPVFAPSGDLTNITPNDGAGYVGGPWSCTIQEIKIVEGNLTNASLAAAQTDANYFGATGCTLANVPTTGTVGQALTGTTATMTPTHSVGWMALNIGGTDQGIRYPFNLNQAPVPSLTPASAGTYVLKVYSTEFGSTVLATSGNIVVSAAASGPQTVVLTGGSSFTVPAGVSTLTSIECWGSGGGGWDAGGNGGDYAAIGTLSVTPGAAMAYQIGVGGQGTNVSQGGSSTWFGSTSTVLAAGGAGGGVGGPGNLNTTSQSVGTTKFVGGQGGGGTDNTGTYSAGGGSSATKTNNGLNSTACTSGQQNTAGANSPSPSTAVGGTASGNGTGSGTNGGSNVEGGAGGGGGYNAGGNGGLPGGGGAGAGLPSAQSGIGGGGQIRIKYTVP